MRNATSLTRPELNAGSMADIAFLMLTFFMITTQINMEKGLPILLPKPFNISNAPVNKRNIFTIQINSSDRFMIKDEIRENPFGVREEIKSFILNFGTDPSLSDHPEKAVVSLKADRGASHRAYIHAIDEIQAAYYEIYAEQAGITVDQFRKLDLNNPTTRALHEKGKKGIPMNISIAEAPPAH
jgi:biopolymer transport protein ExbD